MSEDALKTSELTLDPNDNGVEDMTISAEVSYLSLEQKGKTLTKEIV